MKWLFIDHENIGNLDSLDTSIYRKVYVFVGATHKALKINFIQLHQNVSLEVVKIKNVGQNNLDFHLSYFLGKLDVIADREIEFVMLSKDKGFDHLISFINDSGRKCRRELLSVPKKLDNPLKVDIQNANKLVETPKTQTKTNPVLGNSLQRKVSDIISRLSKIAGKKEI